MKKAKILIFTFLFLISLMTVSAFNVSDCDGPVSAYFINTGGNYDLINDINCTASAIKFNTSDAITFDCHDYTITSLYMENEASTDLNNVIIQNCNIDDGSIELHDATLTNVTIENIVYAGDGGDVLVAFAGAAVSGIHMKNISATNVQSFFYFDGATGGDILLEDMYGADMQYALDIEGDSPLTDVVVRNIFVENQTNANWFVNLASPQFINITVAGSSDGSFYIDGSTDMYFESVSNAVDYPSGVPQFTMETGSTIDTLSHSNIGWFPPANVLSGDLTLIGDIELYDGVTSMFNDDQGLPLSPTMIYPDGDYIEVGSNIVVNWTDEGVAYYDLQYYNGTWNDITRVNPTFEPTVITGGPYSHCSAHTLDLSNEPKDVLALVCMNTPHNYFYTFDNSTDTLSSASAYYNGLTAYMGEGGGVMPFGTDKAITYYYNGLHGWDWNGSIWTENSAYVVGLPSGWRQAGMIEYNGQWMTFDTNLDQMYVWNGSSWNRNTTWENGLAVATASYFRLNSNFFERDGELYIVRDSYYTAPREMGDNNYNRISKWNGTEWVFHSRIEHAMTDLISSYWGCTSAPCSEVGISFTPLDGGNKLYGITKTGDSEKSIIYTWQTDAENEWFWDDYYYKSNYDGTSAISELVSGDYQIRVSAEGGDWDSTLFTIYDSLSINYGYDMTGQSYKNEVVPINWTLTGGVGLSLINVEYYGGSSWTDLFSTYGNVETSSLGSGIGGYSLGVFYLGDNYYTTQGSGNDVYVANYNITTWSSTGGDPFPEVTIAASHSVLYAYQNMTGDNVPVLYGSYTGTGSACNPRFWKYNETSLSFNSRADLENGDLSSFSSGGGSCKMTMGHNLMGEDEIDFIIAKTDNLWAYTYNKTSGLWSSRPEIVSGINQDLIEIPITASQGEVYLGTEGFYFEPTFVYKYGGTEYAWIWNGSSWSEKPYLGDVLFGYLHYFSELFGNKVMYRATTSSTPYEITYGNQVGYDITGMTPNENAEFRVSATDELSNTDGPDTSGVFGVNLWDCNDLLYSENVYSNAQCDGVIFINSDDLVFDCQGYNLTNTTLQINLASDNITIQNCIVDNRGFDGDDNRGIFVGSANTAMSNINILNTKVYGSDDVESMPISIQPGGNPISNVLIQNVEVYDGAGINIGLYGGINSGTDPLTNVVLDNVTSYTAKNSTSGYIQSIHLHGWDAGVIDNLTIMNSDLAIGGTQNGAVIFTVDSGQLTNFVFHDNNIHAEQSSGISTGVQIYDSFVSYIELYGNNYDSLSRGIYIGPGSVGQHEFAIIHDETSNNVLDYLVRIEANNSVIYNIDGPVESYGINNLNISNVTVNNFVGQGAHYGLYLRSTSNVNIDNYYVYNASSVGSPGGRNAIMYMNGISNVIITNSVFDGNDSTSLIWYSSYGDRYSDNVVFDNVEFGGVFSLLNSASDFTFTDSQFNYDMTDAGIDTVWNSNIFNTDLHIQTDRTFVPGSVLTLNALVVDGLGVSVDGTGALIDGELRLNAQNVTVSNMNVTGLLYTETFEDITVVESLIGGIVTDNGLSTKAYNNEFAGVVTGSLTSDFCNNTYSSTNNVECPSITSIVSCPALSPTAGGTAQFEVRYDVYNPRNTLANVNAQLTELGVTGTECYITENGVTDEVLCYVPIAYYEDAGTYDVLTHIGDSGVTHDLAYWGSDKYELSSADECEYYQLLAVEKSASVVEFNLQAGDNNEFADDNIVIYNNGNVDITGLSIIGQDLNGQQLPNEVFGADNFKVNSVQSLVGALSLANNVEVNLTSLIAAGNNSYGELYLIGSMPQNQYPQSYYSGTPWQMVIIS